MVVRLLRQLGKFPASSIGRVVLTLNAPALDEATLGASLESDALLAQRLHLCVIRNPAPLGFGANHNQAFDRVYRQPGAQCAGIFCVINPDIEVLTPDVLAALATALAQPGVGMAYPRQVNAQGQLLDFERALTTPWAIGLRQLGKNELTDGRKLKRPGNPCGVDWVSGAFMAFRADVYAELNGFDTRYFLYCEDVDVCLRLQLAGYLLARADADVVHHTQRRTLKNGGHLTHHVRSLLRLWCSGAYHQ